MEAASIVPGHERAKAITRRASCFFLAVTAAIGCTHHIFLGSRSDPNAQRAVSAVQRARELRPIPSSAPGGGQLDDDTNPTLPKSIRTSSGRIRRLLVDDPISEKSQTINGGRRLSLALVRTVSTHDADRLLDSFRSWEEFPLGAEECRKYDTDLFISFSRKFDALKYPAMSKAVEGVKSLHASTNGWNGCVRSVRFFEADIEADEDLYDAALVDSTEEGEERNPLLWVNGPNRQFERTFRHVQSLEKSKYDAFFLMESDTHPVKANWLDGLVDEIASKEPFALLGSKYDGHAWDTFADRMSLSLLHHTNGNAVYNLSHPLLNNIIDELEAESATKYNAIPFDLRISQMIVEGSMGVPPDFPYPKILDDDGVSPVALLPKPKFAAWWKEYAAGGHEPVKETAFISNFGPTSYLPSHVGSRAGIVHGSNMYLPYDPKRHGTITLVVSDDGMQTSAQKLKDFLAKLDSVDHPFTEIVLMIEDDDEEERAINAGINTWSRIFKPTVTSQQREPRRSGINKASSSSYSDMCEANINSDWFLMTDLSHAPAASIDLMFAAADDGGTPVIPYIPSDSVHCSSSEACVETMDLAKEFYPSMNFFVLQDDVLFHREHVAQFCEDWKKRSPSLSSTAQPQGSKSDRQLATSYIAHLFRRGAAEKTYHFSDAITGGAKKNFLPLSENDEPGHGDVDDESSTCVSLEQNLVDFEIIRDAETTEENSSPLPFFWHIPKSGGTTMLTVLGSCLGLTVASSSGAVLEQRRELLSAAEDGPDSLRVVKDGRATYVNVDVARPDGIARAAELGLVGSGLADVVVSPQVCTATRELFSSERRYQAKAMALLRHPVERATSLFYYLQSATWEETYDSTLRNSTIEEWAVSVKAERNWMVSMLNGEPASLDERHLEFAKHILRDKFVVGLTSEMEESMKRFHRYFRWGHDEGEDLNHCEARLLTEERANSNTHQHAKENSRAWKLLASNNALDMQLYEYAEQLWEGQGEQLSRLSQGGKGFGNGLPGDEVSTRGPAASSSLEGSSGVTNADSELRKLVERNMGRKKNRYPGRPKKDKTKVLQGSIEEPVAKANTDVKLIMVNEASGREEPDAATPHRARTHDARSSDESSVINHSNATRRLAPAKKSGPASQRRREKLIVLGPSSVAGAAMVRSGKIIVHSSPADTNGPGEPPTRKSASLTISTATTDGDEFEVDGSSSFHAFLHHAATGLKLEVQNKHRMEVDSQVFLWDDPVAPNYEGHAFEFFPDGSVCSVASRAGGSATELCLGLGLGEGATSSPEVVSGEKEQTNIPIVLVESNDMARKLLFGGLVQAIAEEGLHLEQEVRRVLPPVSLNGDETQPRHLLLVRAPQCLWLGEGGNNAIAILKSSHQRAELHVTSERNAAEFLFDGSPLGMVIRLAEDPTLSLHVATSPAEAGASLDLQYLQSAASLHRFAMHPDGTVSPVGNHELCIGISLDGTATKLVLVRCTDRDHRIELAAAADVPGAAESHLGYCTEKQEELDEHRAVASARCSSELKTKLRDEGYVKFESAVPQELVRAAKVEINRHLGTGDRNVAAFKNNIGSSKAPVINLLRSSVVPHLLHELLGGGPDHWHDDASNAQLALRFPGDLCIANSTVVDPNHYAKVRRNWHIDGCASDKTPGTSDFFGEIHNFNVLVGVLLSDTTEPMSGELTVYPESHRALAEWFRHPENVERVRNGGVTKLPHNETDDLFPRPPVHCTGRAGDVFVLNHMTAHFVAPNTGPDVRYAVYFRLSHADFEQGDIEPMVNPWRDWNV